MNLSQSVIEPVVAAALHEDLGHGDLTTLGVIPSDMMMTTHVVVREPGTIAGLPLLDHVYHYIDPNVSIDPRITDGTHVPAHTIIAHISGSARALLMGERVALNFLQRMSGIATQTAHYVQVVAGLSVGILDTRKTTPGLRALEKYAVRMGGGVNHRFGLYDGVMLKDNHLQILEQHGINRTEAIHRARAAVGPMVRIEVEVETVAEAHQAARAGADCILLDNMTLDDMRTVVTAMDERRPRGTPPFLEASGGITFDRLRAVAETGVDYISVGALTHSVRALDIGLDVVE